MGTSNAVMFYNATRKARWLAAKSGNTQLWQDLLLAANLTTKANGDDYGQYSCMAYQVYKDAEESSNAATHHARAISKVDAFLGTSTNLAGGANTWRENFIELVWMYDWLFPDMSDSEKTMFHDALNFACEVWLGYLDDTSLSGQNPLRVGDSDQVTGTYGGMLLWSLASGSTYGTGANTGTFNGVANYGNALLTRVNGPMGGADMGGLTATGTLGNRSTYRNVMADYLTKSTGGMWIETSHYNLGTTQLLLMLLDGARTMTATPTLFPEAPANYYRDMALSFMHEVTPNLGRSYQWGLVQDDGIRNLEIGGNRRQQVLAMLHGLLVDAGDTLAPSVLKFRQDIAVARTLSDRTYREMIFGDPSGSAASDFRTGIGTSHYASGMGCLMLRDGTASTRSHVVSMMPRVPRVDHRMIASADLSLYRSGEFVVTHIIGSDDANKEGEFYNAPLFEGISSCEECRLSIAAEVGPNTSYAYHFGGTCGNRYDGSTNNAPPRFVHEWTRSFLYLPSTNQAHDTIVIFERWNLEQPETLQSGTDPFSKYNSDDKPRITAANSAGKFKQQVWHQFIDTAPNTATAGVISWTTTGGQNARINYLLPTATTLDVLNEDTMSFPGNSAIDPDEKKYQVRIRPSAQNRWDTFLCVIQASASSLSTLTNTLVTSTTVYTDSVMGSLPVARGVLVKRPSHNNALFVGNARRGADIAATSVSNSQVQVNTALPGLLRTNSYHTSAFALATTTDAACDLYIADLDPSLGWSLIVNGTTITQAAGWLVSGAGLGRYTIPTAGAKTIQLTPAGDTTPPTISAITETALSTTSMNIAWTTDEAADSQVDYQVQ
jgi:hypothetical protein